MEFGSLLTRIKGESLSRQINIGCRGGAFSESRIYKEAIE